MTSEDSTKNQSQPENKCDLHGNESSPPLAPNQPGYIVRKPSGLHPNYFVAEQADGSFHIIEIKRGNTKALVRQNNAGLFQFEGYWSLPTEMPRFRNTGKTFSDTNQAILHFNRYL